MTNEAGLFAGEITQQAPADQSTTAKDRGFAWFEWSEVFDGDGSGAVNLTDGWMWTQDNFFGGSPSFAHPFLNADYPAFTMSCVCRNTEFPADFIARYLLLLSHFSAGTGMFFDKISTDPGWRFRLGADDGATETQVVADRISMTADLVPLGWDAGDHVDWVWLGCSYDQASDVFTSAIVNLETGRVFSRSKTSAANVNVEFQRHTSGSVKSTCSWGVGTGSTSDPGDTYWRGHISQTMIHNAFLDLTVGSNRNKFVHTDGIINLGDLGENPFGTQPLIYLPNGRPSGNVGTLNIGTYPTDFWLFGTEVIDADVPPVSST